MLDNGIVILLGHPSFVCYEHAHLDFAELKKDIVSSLMQWKNEIEI